VEGKRDWIKAIVAGLVWFCAFAPLQCELAAWMAPAMLLWATPAEPKRAFLLGWVAGAAHFFTSLSWVLYIPVNGSNIIGWVMLSGYCAVYPALWAAFCWAIFPGDRTDAGKEVSKMPFKVRLLWGGACAVGWVAQECLRGWVITGFPWNYLGGSQLDYTQLAMFAQFTGVLGVSLVVAWGSVGALLVFWRWREQDRFTPCLFLEMVGPVAMLMVALALGRSALVQPLAPKRGSLKIALVQPAIPQTVLWNTSDQASQKKRFEDMMDLSEQGVAEDIDLLVWPEASLPPLGVLNSSNVVERFYRLERAVRQKNIWRVWGADTATNGVPYNSAVLLPPEDGFLRGLEEIRWPSYAKQHLVMFGEYVPFSEQLPVLQKLAPVGNFGRGPGTVTFDLRKAKTSVIICFEDVVPKLARRAAAEDVDFLLNLTNDGWFGDHRLGR
jgi:apolipoprotein N-acyltransferase